MSGSNKLLFSVPGYLALFQKMFANVLQKLQGDFLFPGHFFLRKNSVLRNNIAKQIHGGREEVPDNFLSVGRGIFAFENILQKFCIIPDSSEGLRVKTEIANQFVPEIDKSIQPVDLEGKFFGVLTGKSDNQYFRFFAYFLKFVYLSRIDQSH